MDHVKGLQNVVENSKNLGAALPNEMKAFSNLFGEVFKDGALTVKEKEYIALQSQEDGSILLCKYIEKEDGEFEVEEIEDDEEFSKVSDAFDALVEEDDE